MTTTSAPKYVGTRVYYTADVYTPDPPCETQDDDEVGCTCSDVYGDGTEHGHGETESSGWVDPRWSPTTVHEDREDVLPDYPFGTVWDLDEDAVASQIVYDTLVERGVHDAFDYFDPLYGFLSDRIGAIDSFDGDTAYAADVDENMYTGVWARLAAHVYTPDRED